MKLSGASRIAEPRVGIAEIGERTRLGSQVASRARDDKCLLIRLNRASRLAQSGVGQTNGAEQLTDEHSAHTAPDRLRHERKQELKAFPNATRSPQAVCLRTQQCVGAVVLSSF